MSDQIDSLTLLLSAATLLALGWPHLSMLYRVWIALPIKSRSTRKYPLEVKWEETNASELSSEQRDFLRDAILGFRNAGFDVLANLRQKNETREKIGKTRLWLIPMMNPVTGDLASITMITSTFVRFFWFQVISEFADSFYMTTANRRTAVFPTDPDTHTVRFDWVSDPVTLIECHRRRVAQAGRAESPRRPLLADQVIEKINDSWQRDLNWMVRSGYHFLDRSANCVRPTWLGAFLLRWRNLPVVKPWLIRRRVVKARELWNELGMNDWKLPRAAEQVADPTSKTSIELASDAQEREESPTSLAYQSTLASGQIRRERRNGTLILRMMLPTAAQVLERKLPDFGVAGFFVVLFISGISQILSARKTMPVIPWRHPLSLFRLDLALVLVLLVYLFAQIAKGFSRRARGTTLISASAHGLSFSNAPGQIRSGSFQRAQIESINVRLDQVGLSGKVFRLQMNVTTDARWVVLMVSRSAKSLYGIRLELLRAMGIIDQQQEPH